MSNVVYTPVPSTIPFLTSDKYISMIVGPIGCLAGDTPVITEFGTIAISDIDRPMRVLSWDEKTCRYQLSLSSGSFPKGRDYLYRVSTPEGEFVAAAEHRLLCGDGEYRRVADLHPGHVLAAYSGNPLQTNEELCQSGSLEDDPRYSQKDVDSLARYAVSARLRGQQFLSEEDSDPSASPLPDGVRKCEARSSLSTSTRADDQPEQRHGRNHRELPFVHRQTTDCETQSGNMAEGAADRTSAVSFGRVAGLVREFSRSLQNYASRLQERLLSRRFPWLFVNGSCVSPSGLSSSNRPILSITKTEVKQAFWDMQVEGTHNYVTADGAIHHNSTKTTAGIYKIAYEAKRVAAGRDGIRRSRYAWVRQTRQMLTDSSIPDFLKAFPDGVAGVFMKSDMKFFMKFDDVECEVWFRNLDDSQDIRRLLSTQYTGAIIEEFRECHPDIFDALQGRIGRYPDGMLVPHRPEWGVDDKGNPIQGCVDDNGKSVDKIWMMSNPPDADTFWEEKIANPEENTHVTIQPSGLSEEADWIHLLKSNFYENIAVGKTQDWIDVYINAKFGKSLSGKPVFGAFRRDTHVAKTPLLFNPINANGIVVGMDTALHPSAVIGQITPAGRLNILHSLHAADTGALRFIREHLKPVLARRFGGARVVVVFDPAGNQRSQTDEATVADILRAEGLTCRPAGTNSIAARIAAVDSYLTRTIDGAAGILFDPEFNHELIMAMNGKYRYRMKTTGETEDKPDKQRPWADLVDGLQYLCLHADGGATFGRQSRNSAHRDLKPVAARGWT